MRAAYAVVSADSAASLLGLTLEQVGPFLRAQGWTPQPQAAGQFFAPPPVEDSKAREVSAKQLEQLTGYIAHLEED
jgi:hypothetical protein